MSRKMATRNDLRGSLQFILLPILFLSLAQAQGPSPIPVPASESFFGYDGRWSAINIRIGSDSQYISVLPNVGSSETWAIGPGGCDGTFTCEQERGGLFTSESSSTWDKLGDYELDFDSALGDSGSAEYGLDTIALNDAISLPGQIVGVLNTTASWLGQLGLGVHLTRFAGSKNRLTLLSSLVEIAGIIPSHSYGYTAGAWYRLKNVPASLTLGGVDTNRFVPNTATYSLAPQLQPIVAINEISVTSAPSGNTDGPSWKSKPLVLLDQNQADLFTIDSSTPFLWLPEPVCDSFATALGLVYTETLDLYLYNESLSSPETLTGWNMTFTISLSDLPGSSSNRVDITLPYDAFNLQLTYPFPNLDANFSSPPTNYFPLRRATSSDQYTIGRVFLQESYLTVDYERNNFSVSQAKFALNALTDMNLESITRPINSNWTGPAAPDATKLGTGVEAGIAVAAIAFAAVVTALCIYFCYRRRRSAKGNQYSRHGEKDAQTLKSQDSLSELPSTPAQRSFNELPGSKRFPAEADNGLAHWELPGSVPVEMPAQEVPSSFLAVGNNTTESRHRYLVPDSVQHARSASTQKVPLEVEPSMALQVPTSPNLPPYSPVSEGGSLVSPTSPNHPQIGLTTRNTSTSERQVSPLDDSSGSMGNTSLGRPENNSLPTVSPLERGSSSRNFSRPMPNRTSQISDFETQAGHQRHRSGRFSWETEASKRQT